MEKEKIIKISLTKESSDSLKTMLESLNKNIKAKIKKTDLLSWIILNYQKKHFSNNMKKIQTETQNPIDYTKAILKELQKSKRKVTLSEIKTMLKTK